MQRTKAVLAAATLAAVTLGCHDVTGTRGTFRFVSSLKLTGADIAAVANEPLPFVIEPGGEWMFEGPFDDAAELSDVPTKRLRTASAQFRFDTNLDLGAVVNVTMRSGKRRCVLANNMHARERGAAPVHWSSPCTDIFFSPDRVVAIEVVSTNDQEVSVGPKDAVKVSVHAVFNFK